MTTVMSSPVTPAEDVVVPVPDTVDAATLSCRLHAVIADPATLTVVVEAGDRADAPDLARVLGCARDAAVGRGLGFVIR